MERLLAALITGLLDLYSVLRRAASWPSPFSADDDSTLDATFQDGWSDT